MKAFVVVVRDLILVIINTYTFPSSTIDLSLLWKGGRFRAVATAPLSTCATITFGTTRPIAVRSPLGRINMLLFARLVSGLMRLRHEDGQIERFYMGRFPMKEVSKKSLFRPFWAFHRGPPLILPVSSEGTGYSKYHPGTCMYVPGMYGIPLSLCLILPKVDGKPI